MDFAHMIKDAGGRAIATASSAGEAKALTRALNPDVILMDVRLIGPRDGVDAEASASMPITALTPRLNSAFAVKSSAVRALADAQSFLAAAPAPSSAWLRLMAGTNRTGGTAGASSDPPHPSNHEELAI
jgi:two-component system, response regulator PdtaR